MVHDVLIIGGGPAGMTAALYVLRSGKNVLILEKENFGGQIATSPRVENYPSIKVISGLELSDQMFSQISDLGAEFELEDVTGIKKENGLFKVTTNYGEHLAKAVIIANGVTHRHMNLPNEDKFSGKGISYCAVCDGAFYKGQDAYLIGDANTALQYAMLLSNYCPKVYMFTLFDKLFGEEILIEKVKKTENIIITPWMNLIEFKGDDELTGLVFENTKDHSIREYKTNNVFVAIGQLPHNEIYKDLVDLEKGFIITDDNMKSKTDGLYAIGDTRKKTVRQIVTAINDGAIAALEAIKYIG
ncbi:MAG: FAD-dependent oxidoreductase [Bacilli bacterium]|jgi:thioredoxin reductase (NADPH)|nr:FAD-dependent oxidoreductase [Bacilli bacterium]MDD3068964.1 FAD-dependent oxidoreductase [Bacilli bacterium]MDD3841599.1 FAD-dependent oxidoreductase [Bacilli bacterium]HKM10256.1 FAD-dependent oxidoreductase [Bacilli bacterium]